MAEWNNGMTKFVLKITNMKNGNIACLFPETIKMTVSCIVYNIYVLLNSIKQLWL